MRRGSSLARLGRVYGSSEMAMREVDSELRVSRLIGEREIRRSRFCQASVSAVEVEAGK